MTARAARTPRFYVIGDRGLFMTADTQEAAHRAAIALAVTTGRAAHVHDRRTEPAMLRARARRAALLAELGVTA